MTTFMITLRSQEELRASKSQGIQEKAAADAQAAAQAAKLEDASRRSAVVNTHSPVAH